MSEEVESTSSDISVPASLSRQVTSKRSWSFELSLVVLIALFGGAGFFLRLLPPTVTESGNSAAPEETQQTSDISPNGELQEQYFIIRDAVARLYAVPDDVNPTMAMIDDLDKVREQSFYANAQVGDVVLLYETIGKAILYRPSEDRVVEVGPIVAREEIQGSSGSLNVPKNSKGLEQ